MVDSPHEVQLLFGLTGKIIDLESLSEILKGEINWSVFCQLVHRERAASILQRTLSTLPPGLVPVEVSSYLRQLAMVEEFRLSRLEAQLGDVVSTLSQAGVDVVLLKGAGLAKAIYPAFRDRPMRDIDLLVPMEWGTQAQELLITSGAWQVGEGEINTEFYDGHQHLPPLYAVGDAGTRLELHTSIVPSRHPFALTREEIWGSLAPISGLGRGVYRLTPDLQVLHLSIHFAWSHALGTGSWRTSRDLRYLVEAGEVDWERFAELAIETGAATCAYWTLRLARTLTGLEVPESILDLLAPPGPEFWLSRIERHYLSQLVRGLRGESNSVRLQRLAWEWGIRPGWSGHGTIRPWERDQIFEAGRVDEGASHESA